MNFLENSLLNISIIYYPFLEIDDENSEKNPIPNWNKHLREKEFYQKYKLPISNQQNYLQNETQTQTQIQIHRKQTQTDTQTGTDTETEITRPAWAGFKTAEVGCFGFD